jgi:hypothetical protein
MLPYSKKFKCPDCKRVGKYKIDAHHEPSANSWSSSSLCPTREQHLHIHCVVCGKGDTVMLMPQHTAITQRSAQAVLHHTYNVLVKDGRIELARELLALINEDEERKLFYARPLSDLEPGYGPKKTAKPFEPGKTSCCGGYSFSLSGNPGSGVIIATCTRCNTSTQYRSHVEQEV